MKQLNHKPGADARRFKPDKIKTLSANEAAPLLEYLLKAMPDCKRTTLKELLAHDQIMVDGQVTRQFDFPLETGAEVKINFTRQWLTFYNRRMKLVYEDDDVIVVEKGYGLLSMGTDKVKEGTAYSIMRNWVKLNNPANKLFIVHRLDRDTSGLMMFAKNEKAKDTMQHNWNNMVLQRKYVCVVEGEPEEDSGVIRSWLKQNSRFEVYSVAEPEEGAQPAVTRWRKLKSKNGYSLLEVELDTGRKNQIRVHMKEMGHPIAGDRRYGAKSSPIHRLALHAQTLRFAHPITRKDMNFSTPIPAGFLKMVK